MKSDNRPVFIKNPEPVTDIALIASIRPGWNEKIFTFEKEAEIRKNKPVLQRPCRVLVYSTKAKPGNPGLCLDRYGDTLRLGKVFPINYAAAERMGLTLLDGKIIGEFTCDRITEFKVFQNGSIQNWNFADLDKSCVPYEQVVDYIGFGRVGYAWHITDPVLYETPIILSDAHEVFELAAPLLQSPQSWIYAWPKERRL